jgi:hypothetical protein
MVFGVLPTRDAANTRRVLLRERDQPHADAGTPSAGEFRDEQFPELKSS